MDTKPSYLPEMLAAQFALRSAAYAAGRPVPSNVIPFARAAKESPLTKQLKAMAAAHAEFWRQDAEQFEQLRKIHGDAKAHQLMQAARAIVDEFTLKAGETNHALAVVVAERDQGKQKTIAKKPRPLRSQKHAARDQRIRVLATEGKTAEQIGKKEHLSARRVRAILGLKK